MRLHKLEMVLAYEWKVIDRLVSTLPDGDRLDEHLWAMV